MIIIPDVHGRSFWKEAVKKREESEKVVFLGDYLDPYEWEGITPMKAIGNFKEVLEYIKENRETTIALLGNHDCMTYLSKEMGHCRTDFENEGLISGLFRENLDLFKVAWISGTHVFAHSAILPEWIEFNSKTIKVNPFFSESDTLSDIVAKLNIALKKNQDSLWRVLGQLSRIRGGYNRVGSCVWADICEVPTEDPVWPGYYLVFGHSQQSSDPVITEHWACLDCRRAFRLSEDTGKITEL